jgi:hypothetical protein
MQQFEGDLAIEPRIVGRIDDPHRPRPHESQDLVAIDAVTRSQEGLVRIQGSATARARQAEQGNRVATRRADLEVLLDSLTALLRQRAFGKLDQSLLGRTGHERT